MAGPQSGLSVWLASPYPDSIGLNMTRAAQALGYEVLATGPLAGRAGHIVADLAEIERLPAAWYWLSQGETRSCLLIHLDNGDTTVINEPGPTVSVEDWAGFAAHVEHLAGQARAVAFAGSLMLGLEPEALGELARSLVRPDRIIYVDTSAEALSAILARPEGLCLKVNQAELAAGLALKPGSHSLNQELVEAGRRLLDRGAAMVVVTLGRDGALAVAPTGAWLASPPPIEVVSAVGSGDSLLAGLAITRLSGQGLDAALAFAVACGSANALNDVAGQVERNEVEAFLEQISVIEL